MRDMFDDAGTTILQTDVPCGSSRPELISPDSHGHAASQTRSPNSESHSSSSTRSIDLQIIPFDRGNHPVTGKVQPCHWALFAHTGPEARGTVYQLSGMPGAFKYDGPERGIVPADLERRRQEVDIGRIPSDKIRDMEAIIASVPISRSESGYNCQTWTEDILTAMQPHGWLDLSRRAIVQWLKGMEN